jgi:hypothetical protein
VFLIALALLVAAETPADGVRAAWHYKRQVTVPGGESLASLVLPPELSTNAAPGSRDLRLVDEAGREVPYLLDWTGERDGFATYRVDVKDVRREKEGESRQSPVRSQWTLDLGAARTFTELSLHVPDIAFAWHVQVEASTDGVKYAVLQGDAALYDQVWNGERVRRTWIRFEAPITARLLRVTARSAANSRVLEIEGASVTLRRRLKGDAWSLNTTAEPAAETPQGEATRSRYRLAASSLLPMDELEVLCDDPVLSRRARLIEESGSGGQRSEVVLGEGPLYRLRASDTIIAGESLTLPVRRGNGGPLLLEIDNAGSPPLRGLRVRLHGSRVRLVFPVSTATLTLYYGNSATRAPAYDLESLRPRLTQAIGTRPAEVGTEELNPRFQREPPLRFAATLGASLDPSRWLRERPINPLPEEDVYSITLRAQDLSTLRPDLADLRVVNDRNLQVPFLIDPGFSEEKVEMKVRKQGAAPPKRSLYNITLAEPLIGDTGPHLSRVEIEIADAFFERPARLRRPGDDSRREPPFSIVLARRPPASFPISVVTSAPLEAMTLEVDDGDNAPLDVRSAAAIVQVPRIVFKAAPGSLRLLLGNRGAEAPRYDIGGLRSELLAYSAIAARAGTLGPNQGGRESLFSRVQGVPGNTVVWVAIVVAVVALVGLTLKTLKGA